MVPVVRIECKTSDSKVMQIYSREFLNFIGVQHYIEYTDREKIEQDGIIASEKIENTVSIDGCTDSIELIEKLIEVVCQNEEEKDTAKFVMGLFKDAKLLSSIYYIRYLGNRKDLVTSSKNSLHDIAIKMEEYSRKNVITDYVNLNLLYYAIAGSGERISDVYKQFEGRAKNIQLLYGDNLYLDSLMIRYFIGRKSNDTAKAYYMQNKKEFNYGMFSNLAYMYKHGKYFVINNSQLLKLPAIKNPNDLKNFYITACKTKENNEYEVSKKVCKQALSLVDKFLESGQVEPEDIIFGIKYVELLIRMGDPDDYIGYCEKLISYGMENGCNNVIEEIFMEDSLKVMADIIDNCAILAVIREYTKRYKDNNEYKKAIDLCKNALLRYGNTSIGMEKRAMELLNGENN